MGRLVRVADFERVLRTRTLFSSAHFALHHSTGSPGGPVKPLSASRSGQLSTDPKRACSAAVDDSTTDTGAGLVAACFGEVWLGAVVPKRHAKRSVTRTLLKRQIRTSVAGRHDLLASGLWIVRLRAPFDRTVYPSAASEALKRHAHHELEQLLTDAVHRLASRPVLS